MPETNDKDATMEADAVIAAGRRQGKPDRDAEDAAQIAGHSGERVIVDEVAEEELPGLTEAEMAALEPKAAPMSASHAESILDAQVMNVVGVVTRGLIVSSAGVPPDVLLRSMARCFARVVGEAIAGDLAPVFQVRASVREAFEKTLRTIPVKPAPQPQRMPGQPQMRG